MNYQEKYIKYKKKYFELKKMEANNQIGGLADFMDFDSDTNIGILESKYLIEFI